MDSGAVILILAIKAVIAITAATIGAVLAKKKGRNPVGWAIGCFFFSLIGLIILVFLSDVYPIEDEHEQSRQTDNWSEADMEAFRAAVNKPRN